MKSATKKTKKTVKPPEEPPLRRTCGALEVHNRLLETDPDFRVRLGELEIATRRRLATGETGRTGPITIPVVVHVVFNTAAENISVAQINSQIKALNRDYRLKNTDVKITPAPWKGLATDVQVNFALATKDPSNKATNGITRTKTTKTSFGADDSVKSAAAGGVAAWPTGKYLNLWVCTLGGGLLGYAQFPGGPPATDGVVILNRAFGTSGTAAAPFKLGRTAVHEVGHWLNLHHIWGDTTDCTGSDFVADTPNAQHPNFGTPTFPHISCNNGPSGDMFVNYMDYVDDEAMVMFTAGQVARMRSTLDGPRNSIG